MLVKTLKWPFISLAISGGFHFVIEAIWPDLRNMFTPPVLAGLVMAYGIWVGYKMIQLGGTYLQAILALVIFGLLPLVIQTFGWGLILDRGLQAGFLSGIFGFSMVLWGGLVGSGFALSK